MKTAQMKTALKKRLWMVLVMAVTSLPVRASYEFGAFAKNLTGKTYTIALNRDMRVIEAKEKIYKKSCIPIYQQRLIFSGKQLGDYEKLSDHKVVKHSVMNLVLRSPVQRKLNTVIGGLYRKTTNKEAMLPDELTSLIIEYDTGYKLNEYTIKGLDIAEDPKKALVRGTFFLIDILEERLRYLDTPKEFGNAWSPNASFTFASKFLGAIRKSKYEALKDKPELFGVPAALKGVLGYYSEEQTLLYTVKENPKFCKVIERQLASKKDRYTVFDNLIELAFPDKAEDDVKPNQPYSNRKKRSIIPEIPQNDSSSRKGKKGSHDPARQDKKNNPGNALQQPSVLNKNTNDQLRSNSHVNCASNLKSQYPMNSSDEDSTKGGAKLQKNGGISLAVVVIGLLIGTFFYYVNSGRVALKNKRSKLRAQTGALLH